jgi:hypothetical protein
VKLADDIPDNGTPGNGDAVMGHLANTPGSHKDAAGNIRFYTFGPDGTNHIWDVSPTPVNTQDKISVATYNAVVPPKLQVDPKDHPDGFLHPGEYNPEVVKALMAEGSAARIAGIEASSRERVANIEASSRQGAKGAKTIPVEDANRRLPPGSQPFKEDEFPDGVPISYVNRLAGAPAKTTTTTTGAQPTVTQKITNMMSGRAAGALVKTERTATTQPGGAAEPTATGPNGQKMVFRNGAWQPLQ